MAFMPLYAIVYTIPVVLGIDQLSENSYGYVIFNFHILCTESQHVASETKLCSSTHVQSAGIMSHLPKIINGTYCVGSCLSIATSCIQHFRCYVMPIFTSSHDVMHLLILGCVCCNGIDFVYTYYAEEQGTFLTDKMLGTAAQEIVKMSESWMLLGIHLGLQKNILDIIDINSRGKSQGQEWAANEMLWKARESSLLSTTKQLINACSTRGSTLLACKLNQIFHSCDV